MRRPKVRSSRPEGPRAGGWIVGNGQPAFSHQLVGLVEHCKLPTGVRGRPPGGTNTPRPYIHLGWGIVRRIGHGPLCPCTRPRF